MKEVGDGGVWADNRIYTFEEAVLDRYENIVNLGH